MMDENALPKAFSSSSKVRGMSERKRLLTLDQQLSMGLKSGA